MGGLSFGRRVAVTSVSVLALAGVVAGGTGTARAAASVSGGAASVSGGAVSVSGGAVSVSGGAVSISAGVGCPAGASRAVSVSAGSWAGDVPWHSVGRGWILADLAKSRDTRSPQENRS
jgi:putative membrane protein